jgi:hypothetical protein
MAEITINTDWGAQPQWFEHPPRQHLKWDPAVDPVFQGHKITVPDETAARWDEISRQYAEYQRELDELDNQHQEYGPGDVPVHRGCSCPEAQS